jgi:hypothetical protein
VELLIIELFPATVLEPLVVELLFVELSVVATILNSPLF